MQHRSFRLALAALTLLLLAQLAHALNPNPPGKLAVYVAISRDPRFLTEWTAKNRSRPVEIHSLRDLRIGQTAYVAFIVTGHRADKRGVPDVEIDVVIRRPDGSVLTEEKSYARVAYKTGEGGFVLGNPALDLVLEKGDPNGLWTIEATVRDNLSKKRATSSASVHVRG